MWPLKRKLAYFNAAALTSSIIIIIYICCATFDISLWAYLTSLRSFIWQLLAAYPDVKMQSLYLVVRSVCCCFFLPTNISHLFIVPVTAVSLTKKILWLYSRKRMPLINMMHIMTELTLQLRYCRTTTALGQIKCKSRSYFSYVG